MAGDDFRAKTRRARPAMRIPNQKRARPLFVRSARSQSGVALRLPPQSIQDRCWHR